MDKSEPTAETMSTPESKTVSKQRKSMQWLMWLLILVLLAGGAGAYYWRDKTAKQQQKNQQAEITTLQQKTTKLEKDLADEKAKTAEAKTTEKAATTLPTATTIENIKASITSGNTAALQGYMASTVKVIIAASEGIGDRTPTQAIGDLAYLNNATDPWNFALPAATLTAYANGSYSQYFPLNAVVGKSANNYVVSFSFNSAGKISGIFMAVNTDLLQ